MSPEDSHPWRAAALPMIEPDFLADVLGAACDIALIVSRDGEVNAALVNPAVTPFGALTHWEGNALDKFLTPESVPKFQAILRACINGDPMPRRVELNHREEADWQFPVRYSTHRIGHEDAVLMLGRDLQQVAETQAQLVQAQVALERGYEDRLAYDVRYRTILSATAEAFVLVSVADGRIRDINAPAARLLGGARDDFADTLLGREFNDTNAAAFALKLFQTPTTGNGGMPRFVTRRTNAPLTLTPTGFRAAGERMVLVRLDTEDGEASPSDHLIDGLSGLFEKGVDAIVFTDQDGVIDAANDAFVEMVEFMHHSDVKGRNLADYLARGRVDLDAVLSQVLATGRMRVYATKLTNDLGIRTSVEISAVHLPQPGPGRIAFSLRDVSPSEALRVSPGAAPAKDPKADAAEMVGQAPLKEIVALTSDQIEKICIETALRVTENNRAAAAELLGVSRQSLYSKMHKLGLQMKMENGQP